ncbi:hypothetical protein [Streptomyces sp. NPDC048720]|uniref:hypothetical protein n=1 Tax=Streptomyces sp. NPDC048720 TaxID=3365588 RepID=UPI00372348FF
MPGLAGVDGTVLLASLAEHGALAVAALSDDVPEEHRRAMLIALYSTRGAQVAPLQLTPAHVPALATAEARASGTLAMLAHHGGGLYSLLCGAHGPQALALLQRHKEDRQLAACLAAGGEEALEPLERYGPDLCAVLAWSGAHPRRAGYAALALETVDITLAGRRPLTRRAVGRLLARTPLYEAAEHPRVRIPLAAEVLTKGPAADGAGFDRLWMWADDAVHGLGDPHRFATHHRQPAEVPSVPYVIALLVALVIIALIIQVLVSLLTWIPESLSHLWQACTDHAASLVGWSATAIAALAAVVAVRLVLRLVRERNAHRRRTALPVLWARLHLRICGGRSTPWTACIRRGVCRYGSASCSAGACVRKPAWRRRCSCGCVTASGKPSMSVRRTRNATPLPSETSTKGLPGAHAESRPGRRLPGGQRCRGRDRRRRCRLRPQVGHPPGAALVLADVGCFGPLPNVLAAPLADPYNRGSSPLRIIKGQTKPGGGGAV